MGSVAGHMDGLSPFGVPPPFDGIDVPATAGSGGSGSASRRVSGAAPAVLSALGGGGGSGRRLTG
ncbi:MAG: hypothetical protein OJJ54_09755, partial [Pseudonocardia sp.]|nr:hypothetical protein [Pseudonocardia sp.]